MLCELKHEVCGETVDVSLHGAHNRFGFDAVRGREIGVEHDPLAAKKTDGTLNSTFKDQGRVGHRAQLLARFERIVEHSTTMTAVTTYPQDASVKVLPTPDLAAKRPRSASSGKPQRTTFSPSGGTGASTSMWNSTRRFSLRPSSVLLSPTGFSRPSPLA